MSAVVRASWHLDARVTARVVVWPKGAACLSATDQRAMARLPCFSRFVQKKNGRAGSFYSRKYTARMLKGFARVSVSSGYHRDVDSCLTETDSAHARRSEISAEHFFQFLFYLNGLVGFGGVRRERRWFCDADQKRLDA